jgi:hypothetical protein
MAMLPLAEQMREYEAKWVAIVEEPEQKSWAVAPSQKTPCLRQSAAATTNRRCSGYPLPAACSPKR